MGVKQYTSNMSTICQSVIVAAPGIVRLESAELPATRCRRSLDSDDEDAESALELSERSLLNLPGLSRSVSEINSATATSAR